MINRLHRLLHDPKQGWDPISASYAEQYAGEVAGVDLSIVKRVEAAVGGLEHRRVADVGSGPGQYGIAFGKRGAQVTCVDVSGRYLEIARRGFGAAGLSAEFVLAYMEDLGKIACGEFDVVFNNVCWYYCTGDYGFARSLLRATKPGGILFVRVQNAESHVHAQAGRRVRYWMHKRLGWKMGHLFPPRGRVEQAFRRTGLCETTADYSDPGMDLVLVRKSFAGSAPGMVQIAAGGEKEQ